MSKTRCEAVKGFKYAQWQCQLTFAHSGPHFHDEVGYWYRANSQPIASTAATTETTGKDWTHEQFASYTEKLFEEIKQIAVTKGIEYAGRQSRFDNFNKVGQALDLDRKKVLMVYMQKHQLAIESFIREGKVYSESIHGRILDNIIYLMLLDGMIAAEAASAEAPKADLVGIKPGEWKPMDQAIRPVRDTCLCGGVGCNKCEPQGRG
jgi:hypothetical protein